MSREYFSTLSSEEKYEELQGACQDGDIETMRILIDLGTRVDALNAFQLSLFCSCSSKEAIDLLVAAGGDPDLCEQEDRGSALIRFIETQEDSELIEHLLVKGANASQFDNLPLKMACYAIRPGDAGVEDLTPIDPEEDLDLDEWTVDVIRALIRHGADKSIIQNTLNHPETREKLPELFQ